MKPRSLGLVLGLAAFAVAVAHATDKLDYFAPGSGTYAVALTGGDTPATYQVSCATATAPGGPTLLVAAQNAGPGTGVNNTTTTTRPLRNRCFQNVGSVAVDIGSSTVAASDYWVLASSGPSQNLSSQYCTHNSGAYYCVTPTGSTAQTVNVIIETQSVP